MPQCPIAGDATENVHIAALPAELQSPWAASSEIHCLVFSIFRGATTAEKLRGTKVWVPTPKARLGIGCGRGRFLPL